MLEIKDSLRHRALTNFRHSTGVCSTFPSSVQFYHSSLFLTPIEELPYFAVMGAEAGGRK
jgi:hypothetical protein